MAIRIGIVGYGNLGHGVETAIRQNPDTELTAIFTRRSPKSLSAKTDDVPIYAISKLEEFTDRIDVLILCGGSATDLPEQTPMYAKLFNVVDSFDTHARIPQHFEAVNAAAKAAGKISIISCGWDPGMFSLARLYASCILPDGKDYTFWGKGVSQGHSDAIRRIEGVLDARQYTVPVPAAMEAVKNGEMPTLSARQKHTRQCFVAVKEDADKERIEREIKTMPNYFADYDTSVQFVTLEELRAHHAGLPHGGTVLRSGKTGAEKEHAHTIEYSLKLDSNPEFTGSVLVACARAAYRMNRAGISGCKTLLDIPPACLSAESSEELRATLL